MFNAQSQYATIKSDLTKHFVEDGELSEFFGIKGFNVKKGKNGIVEFKGIEPVYSWDGGETAERFYQKLKAAYGEKDIDVSTNAPVHQLYPKSMDSIAQKLSCRLPKPGEWLEAVKQANGQENLRDPSWLKLHNAIKNINVKIRHWSHTGIHDEDDDPSKPQLATNKDDGYAYFTDVNQQVGAQKFYHLKGNVCELLKDGQEYKVGGSSALSPKEYGLRDLEDQYTFSDLGFRLAFDAPPMKPMALFRRYVLAASYMTE
ncbi:MAG: hypothetical protein NE330_22415 [Lentisphaeraceae bacterium]|nr:hypothetical protein [Lentisphaeraceae bacterium]